MLEALLTQSANDMAYSLAMWDAGSIPAFVVKMNALAASLGATATHYVDASGYDPGSVSTAADVLRVAAAGMADPTFAEVVGMSSIDFPGVGTLPNVVSEIGSNGVIGIKSGYTSKAGGCLVLAADRVVGGHSVLVLAAVLGQPTPPPIVPKTTTTTAPRPPPTTTTTTTTATAPAPGVVPPPTTAPDPHHHRPPPLPPPPPHHHHDLHPGRTTSRCPTRSNTPARWPRPCSGGPGRRGAGRRWPRQGAQRGHGHRRCGGGSQHRVAVVAAQSASLLGWPGQQVAATDLAGPGPRRRGRGEPRWGQPGSPSAPSPSRCR